MHVCVFRHVPFEGLGRIETALQSAGAGIEYVDLFAGSGHFPALDRAAGLIFMGGPQSANDAVPFIRSEIEIIARAVEEGRPVLGVCLGAQLIAKALGARVYRNAVKEIGWYPISLTQEASTDHLFAGLGPSETVFHWHGETFDLPPGAELLASSDACRNQAFRAGRMVYGLQFHLEVTPEMVADWCAEPDNANDVSDLAGPIDPCCNAGRLAELSRLVFGRWAKELGPGA